MRALSVRQPWASLLDRGTKTIELRTWTTNYRGPFVVCASLSPKFTGEELVAARAHRLLEPPRGVTICIVELLDTRRATLHDTRRACSDVDAAREYAWSVRVLARLDPTPVKGRLGFWEIDNQLLTVEGHPIDVRHFEVARSRSSGG